MRAKKLFTGTPEEIAIKRNQNRERIAKEAEDIFTKCPNLYVKTKVFWALESTSDEYEEGKDAKAFHTFSCDISKTTTNEEATLTEVNGYVEIKGVDDFLRHDYEYNHGEISGTIPFEIFHTFSDKAYFGWGLTLYNVDQFNEGKRAHNRPETGVEPGTLVFILFDGYEEGKEKPFAVIAFEDIGALRERLREILPDEWNLDEWNMPELSDREYWGKYIDFDNHGLCACWDTENGGMIQNCYHIPFRRLADLATVTVYGAEDPKTGADNPDDYDMQENRLNYIKQNAYDIKEKDDGFYWKPRRATKKLVEAYELTQDTGDLFLYYMIKRISIHRPEPTTIKQRIPINIPISEYRAKQNRCAERYTWRHKNKGA